MGRLSDEKTGEPALGYPGSVLTPGRGAVRWVSVAGSNAIPNICLYGKEVVILPRGDMMRNVPVRWTVRPLLQRHRITPYRLMKESGLAQGTVYRLVNGDTRSLSADTLDRVMTALRSLTGEDIAIADLLQYEEPPR